MGQPGGHSVRVLRQEAQQRFDERVAGGDVPWANSHQPIRTVQVPARFAAQLREIRRHAF